MNRKSKFELCEEMWEGAMRIFGLAGRSALTGSELTDASGCQVNVAPWTILIDSILASLLVSA